MADIICSEKQFKKTIFRNKICAANKKYSQNLQKKMNERAAADGQKTESLIHILETKKLVLQIQINKFKSADSEWD